MSNNLYKNDPIIYGNSSDRQNSLKKNKLPLETKIFNKKIIIIFIASLIVLITVALLIYFFIFKKPQTESQSSSSPQKSIEFEPGFYFKTNIGQLNRIRVEQNYIETTVRNGKEIIINFNRVDIYDIYVISESDPPEDLKYNFKKLYTCAISIVAECESMDLQNCEPQKLLDIAHPETPTEEEKANLKNIDDLKDIPLPLCLFNITDNNGITSIKCPNSINERKIRGIILDLYFYRPPGIKRVEKNKFNITTDIQNLEGGKVFVRETNGGQCRGSLYLSFCSTDMNTTKDSKDNFISYKERAYTNITQNYNNYYLKDKYSYVLDITKKNNEDEAKLYKEKMEELLEKLNPYMEYYEQISKEQFKEIYDISINGKLPDRKRKLNEHKSIITNEENIFEYSDPGGETIFLSFFIDSSINTQTMKSKSYIKFGESQINELADNNLNSILTEIINKLSVLSKAGNHLANLLYQNIKYLMQDIITEIEDKIYSLNNIIVYKNITKVFDTSLDLGDIEKFPSSIVEESMNLYNNINFSFTELDAPNIKKKFKTFNKNIYDFLIQSHQIINILSNNLKDLGDSMKTEGNQLTKIAFYYLKKDFSKYMNTAENASEILENYYKNEATLIKSKINMTIEDFENNLLQNIEDELTMIKQLCQKLENKNLYIENIDDELLEKTINNFHNLTQKIDDIINKIKSMILKEMDLKGEYFLSEYDINLNNISFRDAISKAKDLAYNFDNDQLIDKVFDEIMSYFRQNFSEVLFFMNRERENKFFFEEEVLSDLFSKIKKSKIEQKFKDLSRNVINEIKAQFDQYENKINLTINNFLNENEEELNSLILDLNILFSNESLVELAELYDKAYNSSLNKIKRKIKNNELLAKEYFDDMVGAILNTSYIMELLHSFQNDSEHIPEIIYYQNEEHYLKIKFWNETITAKKITEAYLSKYSTYKVNSEYSKEYIKNQLNLDIIINYKQPIIKLRKSLQSIKNHNFDSKYSNFSQFRIKEHKNTIDILFRRIDEYLNDEIFNEKYNDLQTIKILLEEANEMDNYLIIQNNKISKDTINYQYDADYCLQFLRIKSYYCPNTAWRYTDYSDDYCLPISRYSNNHLKLEEISFNEDDNIKKFNETFNEFYSSINEKIDNYNSKMNMLEDNLTKIENEIMNSTVILNYLSSFKDEFNLILNESYGDKLIQNSYNYFKNATSGKMKFFLNSTESKWISMLEKFEEDLKINTKNFTSSNYGFLTMARHYESIILQNISKSYYDSIINYQRNELNYTITYYYDYLLKLASSTYNYIINRILKNRYNFNYIIEKRKNLLDEFFDDLMENITLDKNNSLNNRKQLITIGNEENDFFEVKNMLDDHIQHLEYSLEKHISIISSMKNTIPQNQNSATARMYLENLESEKEIIKIINTINDKTFFSLNEEKFKEIIINNEWVFNFDEFINEIEVNLFNLKNEINEKFSKRKKNYTQTIENLMNIFFTKESIIQKINQLYKDGVKKIDNIKKKNILENINNIINNIDYHFSKEKERLETRESSFNEDESTINNTIKGYKREILNKLNESIIFVVNDFYEIIQEKFYKNYIEKCFNTFYEDLKVEESTYEKYNFLNFSYRFDEIINNILLNIKEEYKSITKKQLLHKYNKELKEIYLSINLKDIQNLLDSKIDSNFEQVLLPILRKKAIKDAGYGPYNLNIEIQEDITNNIDDSINNIKKIINSTKGYNYKVNLSNYNWTSEENFDFSHKYETIHIDIKMDFDLFFNEQKDKENKTVNDLLEKVIENNFNNLISYLVPSFGRNYFDKIVKYNENFKITGLYNNIKYSLSDTLAYYISFAFSISALPEDLKKRLFELNNFDSTLKNNNEELLKKVNEALDEFISQITKFIKEKYSSSYLNEFSVEPNLNKNVLSLIKSKIRDVDSSINKICKNTLNKYIKEPFMKSYINLINKKTNEIIGFVNEQKETLRQFIYEKPIINSDSVLNNSNEKLNKLEASIDEYYKHFKNFTFDIEIIEFLNTYGKDTKPLFKNLIDIINNAKENNRNNILLLLNENSKKYEDSFNLEDFLTSSDNIYLFLKDNYIQNIINNISLYDPNNYEEKLEEQKENYKKENLRRLEGKETEEDIEKRYRDKIVDKALDITFQKILSASELLKLFIDSYGFNNFTDKINDYMSQINENYENSQKIIFDKKEAKIFDNNLSEIFTEKLSSLQNKTKNYYNSIKERYEHLKNYLQESIHDIYNSLIQCYNVTQRTFKNEYKKIKEEILPNAILANCSNGEKENNVEYNFDSPNNGEIKYDVMIKNSKNAFFSIDFDVGGNENNTNEVMAKIINLSGPKIMKIKIKSGTENCPTRQRAIDAYFKTSNYSMIIVFNTNSTKINVTTIANFEDYDYEVQEFKRENKAAEVEKIIINGVVYIIDNNNDQDCSMVHISENDYNEKIKSVYIPKSILIDW